MQHVGSQFPGEGSNLCTLHWKLEVLTTGQPEKLPPFSFSFGPPTTLLSLKQLHVKGIHGLYLGRNIRQYFNFLGTRTFKSHSKLQNQRSRPQLRNLSKRENCRRDSRSFATDYQLSSGSVQLDT